MLKYFPNYMGGLRPAKMRLAVSSVQVFFNFFAKKKLQSVAFFPV